MQLLHWKYHIPILSPHDVAVFKNKLLKFLFIKILVVLRMGMTMNEITNVYGLVFVVAENQFNTQITGSFGFNNSQSVHFLRLQFEEYGKGSGGGLEFAGFENPFEVLIHEGKVGGLERQLHRSGLVRFERNLIKGAEAFDVRGD